jgi:hypothetical protein
LGLVESVFRVDHLAWKLDLGCMFATKTPNNVPRGIVRVLEARDPASIGYHVLPEVCLQLLLPFYSFFHDLAPLCHYHNNIRHCFVPEYSPKHLQVLQRGSLHPTVGDAMDVNDGDEIRFALVTMRRSVSMRTSRRNKLTFLRATQQSWSGSPNPTGTYRRSQGCQRRQQDACLWDG